MPVRTGKSIIAYRCPVCGTGILSAVGYVRVAEAAGRVTLRCSDPDCPASMTERGDTSFALDILCDSSSGTPKLTFGVPCIFCGKPHVYTASSDLIETRAENDGCLSFECPVSGIGLAFTGEENHVKAELAASDLEIMNALGDEGDISKINSFNDPEEALPDPEITQMITFLVRDLEEEGKLFCLCSFDKDSDAPREIEIEPCSAGIRVSCTKCHAAKMIPAQSLAQARAMLEINSLTLDN